MQCRPVAIGAHVEDGGRGRHALEALHGGGVDAVLLHGHQHPVGLLVVAHGTDGEALQPELGGIDDGAARGARNGEADFLDEVDIAAIGNARDGAAQHIEDVEPDHRNVVTHVSRGPSSWR